MPLADQAHQISGPVDDDRKQVGNVAADHAHVKGGDFGERRELTSKGDSVAVLTEKTDLGLDTDGGARTTYPGKLIRRSERRQRFTLRSLTVHTNATRKRGDRLYIWCLPRPSSLACASS
ncbi:MAG: hypothetical protein ACLQVF_08715 [Isosphaeraceae bacterium]